MVNNNADAALVRMQKISRDFRGFLANQGSATEADTRAKMIDRVLVDVCMWPESDLDREPYVRPGYADYRLSLRKRPYVVVEAKREGRSFVVPHSSAIRSPQLDGALVTDEEVKAAIEQVRSYCDELGAKFAIATNGDCWIVFRAIRDDMSWRRGRARIFPSADYICEHFTEFWNLLSYAAICEGSLDTEFGTTLASPRKLVRVVDRLINANRLLERNRLHLQLQPLAKHVFEDIASQEDTDLLKSCYVYSRSLWVLADDLQVAITDTIPKSSMFAGTKPLKQTEDGAGEFGTSIEHSVTGRAGDLYLLLGGIGSGKTTFLRRYERVIAREFLDDSAFMFHLDFLQAPLEAVDLEEFVWSTILETIRTKYAADDLEEQSMLSRVFEGRLANLRHTALRGLKPGTVEYEREIGKHLLSWQEDVSEYVPRLLKVASLTKRKAAVLVVDNVDQLDPEYQARIFLLAQRVARRGECVTIIALREESYYAPSIQNTFTAYTTHKFHIASPSFGKLIRYRVGYAIAALEKGNDGLSATIPGVDSFDTKDICEFLHIVEASVFDWSRRISRFVECVCFGNMRRALQMFTTFLTSGATDVDKMLLIYRRDGGYNVAFHEFLKSVMLQDRAYYKEDQSPIFNLFNCTAEKNASHFTAIRLLRVLLGHRGESTRQGQGYIELGWLVGCFADVFDDAADVMTTLDRMLNSQLIEVNTRATDTVVGASHVRVTSAGWYYLNYLCASFAYLDLVLQDTPLNDEALAEDLCRSVAEVDNLGGRDQDKLERIQVRFARTQKFLEYLAAEEARESEVFGISRMPAPLSTPVMSELIELFQKEKAYIESRVKEGRFVDAPDKPDDSALGQLDLSIDEEEEVPLDSA